MAERRVARRSPQLMMSLAELLAARMSGAGAAPTQVWEVFGPGRQWSGRALSERGASLADALREAGVRPGHPVAVMLPDGGEVVAALLGVWLAQGVYAPLNPRAAPAEVDRILAAIRPAAVVTGAKAVAGSAAAALGVPCVAAEGMGWQVWPGQPGQPGSPEGRDVEQLDADIALIQFTSGTTGRPRPISLRHSGVLKLLDGVLDSLAVKPAGASATRRPMPNLIPVSLSLWAGLYQILFAVRVGAPIVVLGPFTTTGFAAAVRRFGIRSTVLPPAAMTMLADDASVTDLSPLKYVRSISAPLSPLSARRFRDRFHIAVLNGYGQTEIGGEIVGWKASDVKEWGDAKLGSVGRPHTGVAVRVIAAPGGGDGGDVLGPDESGELWVRTPAMSAGYVGGDDLSDRMSPDGWFRTGDVGRVDEDGFVWIEGRISDMINRGGLKVFPEEVAEVIRLLPEVRDAAVVGAPDERVGEVPWAFVVVVDGGELDTDALDQWCRRHLAPYKVPARWHAVDGLPRNEIGKVLARELLANAPPVRR